MPLRKETVLIGGKVLISACSKMQALPPSPPTWGCILADARMKRRVGWRGGGDGGAAFFKTGKEFVVLKPGFSEWSLDQHQYYLGAQDSWCPPQICLAQSQSYLTLCSPMDCNPPSSSVPGISQAGILEWVVTPGDLPNPGIEPASPMSPALQVDFLLVEPLGKSSSRSETPGWGQHLCF